MAFKTQWYEKYVWQQSVETIAMVRFKVIPYSFELSGMYWKTLNCSLLLSNFEIDSHEFKLQNLRLASILEFTNISKSFTSQIKQWAKYATHSHKNYVLFQLHVLLKMIVST